MNWINWIAVIVNAGIIVAWVAAARAQTQVACEPMGSAQSIEIAPQNGPAPECGTYLDEAGQSARVCQWQFAYRSDAALAVFDASMTALDGCFKKTVADTADVNHPDSYNQVVYSTENAMISLSLKDKAQHQATYLFLRIETAP